MPLSPAQRAQNARNKKAAQNAHNKALALRANKLIVLMYAKGLLKDGDKDFLFNMDRVINWVLTVDAKEFPAFPDEAFQDAWNRGPCTEETFNLWADQAE